MCSQENVRAILLLNAEGYHWAKANQDYAKKMYMLYTFFSVQEFNCGKADFDGDMLWLC